MTARQRKPARKHAPSPRERDLEWLLERQAKNFAECQGDPEAALAIWRAAVDTFARLEAERRQ